MDKKEEFDYIVNFIKGLDYVDYQVEGQLLALWTAFCLHQNIDADTLQYDNYIVELFETTKSIQDDSYSEKNLEKFCNMMCSLIV